LQSIAFQTCSEHYITDKITSEESWTSFAIQLC